MPETPSNVVTRRLAAIVIADVVGYTRLMERDDTGTYARVRLIRNEVVDPAIVLHGGRVVKSAGDGLLAEFASALAALRASIQIQRQMASRNETASADERVDYRFGVNLGDIMVEDGDIAGDGVNVASRLEALATPGGVCVSSAVRDQVHGQLDIEFVDRGEHQVKNIARPLRVFAVQLDLPPVGHSATAASDRAANRKAADPTQVRPQVNHRRFGWAASLVAIVAAALLVTWWNARTLDPPHPPSLSIGIRPLVATAGDLTSTERAEALTRDLTSQLALADVAIRTVPVVAAPGGRSQGDTIALARAINVRYILEGDTESAPKGTTIRLRLISGATGEQVWSESVALNEASAPSPLRSLRRSMEHLRSRLFDVEIRRVVEGNDNSSPMDYVLRAYAIARQGDPSLEQLRRQEALYDEALRLDPDLVPALLGVRAALGNPTPFDIAYFLAAAYGHEGLSGKAAEEKAKILKRSPGFTIAELRAKRYSVNPEYMRLAESHWYSGLRKAGIPDH